MYRITLFRLEFVLFKSVYEYNVLFARHTKPLPTINETTFIISITVFMIKVVF